MMSEPMDVTEWFQIIQDFDDLEAAEVLLDSLTGDRHHDMLQMIQFMTAIKLSQIGKG